MRGVLSHTTVNGRTYVNLDAFAASGEWDEFTPVPSRAGGRLMIYSYTQLSHYLACPRKYRYRYLDGWQEKETRAGLLFGRAFESALAAYFHRLDATEALFKEWSRYPVSYTHLTL